MPSPGTLAIYRTPKGPGVRIDDGVNPGSVVSSLYDPMVAKLIVSAADRDACIRRALTALREYEIEGIQTNLPLLSHVLKSAPFAAGRYTTGILKEIPSVSRPELTSEAADLVRVLAALAVDDAGAQSSAASTQEAQTGWSAWAADGLRRSMGGSL